MGTVGGAWLGRGRVAAGRAWEESAYRRVVVAMWQGSPARSVVAWASMAAGVALSLVFVIVIGDLVGGIPAAIAGGPGSPAAAALRGPLLAVAAVLAGQQVAATLQRVATASVAHRAEGALRERVMRAALAPRGVLHLHDARVAGDIASATTVGTARFGPMSAIDAFGPVTSSLLTGLAMAGVVAHFRWWLGLLLAAAWWQARRNRWRDNNLQFAVMGSSSIGTRRQGYFRDVALTPAAAKEIRVFGLGSWVADRFHDHWQSAMGETWEVRRRRRPSLLLTLVVLVGANVAAALVVADAAVSGAIGLAQLTVLLQAILRVSALADPGAVTVFDVVFTIGASTLGTVRRLEERLGLRPGRADPLPAEAVAGPALRPGPVDIDLDAVHFAYPGGPPVLQGFSLRIPAGRSIAVVGANGAGKTTLVKLLAGLVEPTGGSIAVGGSPLPSLPVRAWRRRLAVVFQDFARFHLTAADNVRLGAAAATLTVADLDDVAERSGFRAVVERLPSGWDTPLSSQLVGGVDLSGGEWQRLALARALAAVKAGASVLVLDEPTANLDVRSEAAFYERFLDLTRGLTTVVISHRFSTVRRADLICVLAGGRVAELGSHDELMASGGTYADLFTVQASGFAGEATVG